MALVNTKEHLKFVKAKLNQLKATPGLELAFCILQLKGSKDVVVHVDRVGSVSKLKNPVTIQRTLKKTKAFKIEDDGFYRDPGKLISMTGVARNTDGAISFEKRRGRVTEKVFRLGLRLVKFKADYTFGAAAADDDGAAGKADALVAKSATLSRDDLIHNRGGLFTSVEELGDIIEHLSNKEDLSDDERRTLYSLRSTYRSLEAWSDEGIEPVADAMEMLGEVTDYSEEEQDLADAEALSVAELTAELETIRAKTRELLKQKDFWGHVKRLLADQQMIPSIKTGRYQIVNATRAEYGGEPVMLVSPTASFALQEEFDTVKTGSVFTGRFQRSKSGKKIALIPDMPLLLDRVGYKQVLKKLGVDVEPYIVTKFTDLQTQLQALKPMVDAENLRDANLAARGYLHTVKAEEIIRDPILCHALVAHTTRMFSVENVTFLVNAMGLRRPSNFPTDQIVTGTANIYEAYIPSEESTFTINVDFAIRDQLVRAAEARGADGLDFSSACTSVLRFINGSVLPDFRKSPEMAEAIAEHASLRLRLEAPDSIAA